MTGLYWHLVDIIWIFLYPLLYLVARPRMTPVVAKKTYFTVWAALLMLVLLTWGSVYLPLGSMNVVINLVIAAVKALLVMFFFMHLRSSHALIRVMTFGALFCGSSSWER